MLPVSMTDFVEIDFFQRAPEICARELIGHTFTWGNCSGRVVETEAYAEHGDEACHTFFRPSAREFVSNHEAGTAYVYLNYGMYWLTNVLCRDPDSGNNGFVLLRAVEPVEGLDVMRDRRRRNKATDLCSGPGKLSMAFGIDQRHHGVSLISPDTPGGFRVGEKSSIEILPDRRIGISRAKELKWRFLEKGSPHLSVPFGKAK